MQKRPKEIDVVRKAYQLWQQAGEPAAADDEFYFRAKQLLQESLNSEEVASRLDKDQT
jgi:hypothetical protein